MARIEGITIRNFRALKDVSLFGLTPLTAVIGKNGVGKSTLFDAFGFLSDCLRLGVEEACDARGRGGFERIRSKGQQGPIGFFVYYREDGISPVILFSLAIDSDQDGRPFVLGELLLQFLPAQKRDLFSAFLALRNGKGIAWRGEQGGEPIDETWDGIEIELDAVLDILFEGPRKEDPDAENAESVELSDPRRLGIATLGALKQHPRIARFRQFIEGWYLSYFDPNAARELPMAGPQKHLNSRGDNLGNVVQFMEREHKGRFQGILDRIATRIPGIDKIDTQRTPDGRLLLRFNDRGFQDPFYAPQVSDGTLKVFAYLLLLEDPTPPPFLCIEEPENGLYHKLLETLAREFREHTRREGGAQILVTTHQPYFVDALDPEEVWVLEKGDDGFVTARRASEDPIVRNMVGEGLPLGGLWYSDYLDAS
uniref:Predicted ATPase n=1 Tax=Candidatus Kentrum sp. LFY TaxID=2126342 RepID=A0A450URY7_9GAMM|nr:MAG: Predicted ATPase [Candidatus Kentron sp. LFY]